jgi:hypothetical protein
MGFSGISTGIALIRQPQCDGSCVPLLLVTALTMTVFLVPVSLSGAEKKRQPSAAALISVGPNIEVSQVDDANGHDEVLIAAHPADPNQLVACSMVNYNRLAERKMHTAVYSSTDGGMTWDLGPQIPESGDPICTFGPDGAAYFGAIGDSPSLDPAIDWHLKLYRSTDQFKTWQQVSDILTGDRPWLTFDHTHGQTRGWGYITYQSRAGVLDAQEKELAVSLDLTHSSDKGSTWSLPRAYGVINAHRRAHSLATGMAIRSDGTVVISNWQSLKKSARDSQDRIAVELPGDPGPPTCEISVVLVPPDGWQRPKTVKAADKYCSEGLTTRTTDSLAVDGSSEVFKDRIYIAWTDARSGHSRIMFTYSADKGETWSKPRIVDEMPGDLPYSPDSFMPSLAINKDGVVGLSWNDRRENPDNVGYFTRFTASLDGGESWLPSVRLAERPARFRQAGEGETISSYATDDGPNPPTVRIVRTAEFHGGDTAGLCADANGVFHALWVDNRDGRDQAYTSSITVRGNVVKNGDADLSSLKEVANLLTFDIKNVDYDTKRQTLVLQASLRNKSKDNVRGRLVLRILSLTSQAGAITITNAENGADGPGATFEFTKLVSTGGLKPNESTEPKTIDFQLQNVRLPPLNEKNMMKVMGLEFVSMDVAILGEAHEEHGANTDSKK